MPHTLARDVPTDERFTPEIPAASSPTAETVEARIAALLVDRLGPVRCERFFGSCPRVRCAGAGVEVSVSSAFVATLLDRQMREVVQDAVREVTGETPTEVRFVVAAEPEIARGGLAGQRAGEQAASPTARAVAPRANLESPRSPKFRHGADGSRARFGAPLGHCNLAHFVVGSPNRIAYEAALRLSSAEPALPGMPALLVVHGDCGVGKTHLLNGLTLRAQQLSGPAASRSAMVVSGEAFVSEYIAAVRGNRVDAFRSRVRSCSLFCLDDVSALIGKTATQQELVYTLDALASRGARVCISSPRPIKDLRAAPAGPMLGAAASAARPGLSDALVSRMLAGMVVQIGHPDQPMRELIAKATARRRGIELDDDAARTLACSMPLNASVRELEGLVIKVEAIHRLLHSAGLPRAESGSPARVGSLTIRQALEGIGGGGGGGRGDADASPASAASRSVRGGARPPVRFAAILAATCTILGVSEAEVMASGRHQLVVLARALCVHAARESTNMSYPEIARALGRPNHSSVITAHQRIKQQLGEDLRVYLGPERGETMVADLAQRVRVMAATA